jgi:hypothetical protein
LLRHRSVTVGGVRWTHYEAMIFIVSLGVLVTLCLISCSAVCDTMRGWSSCAVFVRTA